jgi:hypothetical protein
VTPPSNKQTRKASEATARERAAALKAQAARDERRRKNMARGGVGLAVLAVVGAIVGIGIANSNGGSSGEKLTGALPTVSANGAKTAPPWAAPTNVSERANLAGLNLLPNETLDRHDHAHLDIIVDGKPVALPAYIGIEGGANSTGISSLHTHDDSGVIHIESPAGKRFTLGQVFDEWNVFLSPTEIGSLKNGTDGKTLTYYLNGKKLTTDPNNLELLKHEEIAVVYGTAAENAKVKVPSTYKWTNGL